jgi:phosphatidate cytidylyltransferase
VLRDRLATSAVLIAAILGLVWLDIAWPIRGIGGLWLLPLLLFFTLGTAWDIATLWGRGGRAVSPHAALGGAALVVLAACAPWLWPLTGSLYPPDCPVGTLGWIVLGAAGAILGIVAAEMSRFTTPGGEISLRVQASSWIAIYVGLPMAMLVALRMLGSSGWGLAALLSLVIATKSADAGAYFTGKLWGRHKLIPRISPGKTWEGAVGGLVVAILASFACLQWLFPALAPQVSPYPWWGGLLLGTVAALAGMFGDLSESLFKRDGGVKDSGDWLPGLGGVWDVTDSLLGAAVPGFLCFAVGAAGIVA